MITVKELRARGKERWIADDGIRGEGRLIARVTADGNALFYFQYFHSGKKKAKALGSYDEAGDSGLSLPQARARAGALSKLYRSGITDIKGHLEREREEADSARQAKEEAARRAKEEAQRGTLRQLLDAYAGHLARLGKQSARDVRNIFTKNVLEASPALAKRRAADLSVDDGVMLISKLVEAGKGRTADKLRSYMRAAYQLAIESKTNPAAPMALRAYGITVNPFASIGALSQFNRARDRVLSAPELGALLRRVDAIEAGAQKDALQLCLLLGGQRPMQLLRVKPADIDLAAGTVTLYDGKGARSQPRRHVLPLVKDAAAILARRLEVIAADAPLFSTDTRACMRHETVSTLVSDLADKMVEEGESREKFQLRDLRRTCETQLASLKVSSDVRAQLQSHGLGGIQQRHYNFHDYALEKKQALEKWSRHMSTLKAGKTADVVTLAKKRAAREEADAR